jgi:hypothetical protein
MSAPALLLRARWHTFPLIASARKGTSTPVTVPLASYDSLKEKYFHPSVDHTARQYVVGAPHTQTIDRFWSLVKRGMVGTFHKMSWKHPPLYVPEFKFRYNNWMNNDIFGAAVSAC